MRESGLRFPPIRCQSLNALLSPELAGRALCSGEQPFGDTVDRLVGVKANQAVCVDTTVGLTPPVYGMSSGASRGFLRNECSAPRSVPACIGPFLFYDVSILAMSRCNEHPGPRILHVRRDEKTHEVEYPKARIT